LFPQNIYISLQILTIDLHDNFVLYGDAEIKSVKFIGEIIMRKIGIVTFVVGVLAVGLVGMIFAQKGKEGNRSGFAGKDFPPQFLVERIANELGMNEEQKTQAKSVIEASKERVKPLMEQMKQSRETVKDLGTDGNFDEAKVNEIANQQSETMKQLFIEKEKTKAQLFAILTPEQREKAKAMQDKFAEKMKGRFGRPFGEKGEKPAPSEE
jgi:periplasmic protein CpxP/Spy